MREAFDDLRLGNVVEVAAPVKGQADVGDWFQVTNELAVGAAGALGNGAELASFSTEEGHQKIGLAKRGLFQGEGLAVVGTGRRHGYSSWRP